MVWSSSVRIAPRRCPIRPAARNWVLTSHPKPRGYYAPAGTSQEVLDLLADAIEEVTKTEEFATLVEGYGWEINFVRGSEMQPKIEAWAEELAPVFQEILNAN